MESAEIVATLIVERESHKPIVIGEGGAKLREIGRLARTDVAAMLVPVFLPFNLLKGCLNATITVLLYKPVVQGLRHAHLLPPSKTPGRMSVKRRLAVWLGALAVLAVCIVLILILHGTI